MLLQFDTVNAWGKGRVQAPLKPPKAQGKKLILSLNAQYPFKRTTFIKC